MNIVLLWLVMIALPVQSFAAIGMVGMAGMAAMNGCSGITHPPAQQINSAGSHQHHDASSDQGAASQCDAQTSSHSPEKSHHCHSCCPGTAVFSSIDLLTAPPRSGERLAITADTDFVEHYPPALERPPSFIG